MNDQCSVGGCATIKDHETRIRALEEKVNTHEVVFAKINTKLNGILWGVGVIGTAIIGVLIKMLFGGAG